MNPAKPKYPADSLPRSIELATKIFHRKKLDLITDNDLLECWSLQKIRGHNRSSIAAMRHYGLMTEASMERRLTDLAQTLIETPTNSQVHREALRRAALNPRVFKKVFEMHPDASDEKLADFLESEEELGPGARKRCISSYRNTALHAKLTTADALENDASASNRSSRSGEASPETMSVPVMLEPGLMAEVVLPAAMTKERWARLLSVLKIYAE